MVQGAKSRNNLTAHCPDWETWPVSGVPVIYKRVTVSDSYTTPDESPTCASKISISGAERPTYVPSEWTGPGWDSPGHVHLDNFCPGR